MKRVMTWTIALIVVIAGFAVMGDSQASAGLFDRNKCCKPAKCKKVRKCRKSKCCKPVACSPAPCEEAAPCGCEAPVEPCGCPEVAADCGCKTKCKKCCSRRQIRKAKRKSCCPQECSSSPCGEASPCGCSDATEAPVDAEQAPDLPEDATT